MKNTKREWMPLYSYLDRTAITAHLSDMAAQGWMLENIGGWSWRYRRAEPKKLRFALVFFPASQFDPPPPLAGTWRQSPPRYRFFTPRRKPPSTLRQTRRWSWPTSGGA